jgi:nucleoside-diphosphate-sugar epimerase
MGWSPDEEGRLSRYIVTGAAGFIGSQLADALQEAGHDVAGVDCFTDFYDVAEKEENARGLDMRRADLADEDLDLDGVDGVFHLAAQAGVRSFGDVFPTYVRRNLLATQRVFESCSRAGVRVVLASSSSVYGESESYPTPEDAELRPISPYGITKVGCEHLARAYAVGFGLDAVTLRYFTVYGPRQRPDMFFRRVCDALLDAGPFEIFGSGAQSRSFTYVGDAVEATIAAMARAEPGAVFNVGGGEAATMLEAIALLERISGRRLDVRHVAAAKGDVARTSADVSRIREELGWRPGTPLDDGLARMWSWASARVAAG